MAISYLAYALASLSRYNPKIANIVTIPNNSKKPNTPNPISIPYA